MSLQNRFKKYPAASLLTSHSISGPRLLNIKDAAEYLGAHPWAIRQMIRSRELPHIKIGRAHMIDRFDLDRYIEENKVGVAA
jgi:excisionase family DNA binding protein